MRKICFVPIALMIGMLTIINPVHAAEMPDDTALEEAIDELAALTDEEPGKDVAEGDGMAEPITMTKKDDVNNCQISFKCDMPKGFNLGAYTQFMNTQTGDVYQIIATASNDYSARMWIPAGEYAMLTISVWDDTVGDYPMKQDEDFSVEEGSNYSITSTLLNYSEIEDEINKRLNGEDDVIEAVKEEPEEEIIEETPTVILPWREVIHTGDGAGTMEITGTATEKFDLVVEITSTGTPAIGEFRYSTDNGASWSDVARISDINEIFLTDEEHLGTPTGISLKCNRSDTFLMYDKYQFSMPVYEYDVEHSPSLDEGVVRFSSDDILYDIDADITVKITKSGGLGIATFQYDFNGWSDEYVIPENGEYMIPDTGIKLTFWDGFGDFAVGDCYVSEFKTEKSERDYRPYIIGIVAVLSMIAFVVIMMLLSEKEKPYEYKLNTYNKVKLPEKRGKRASRKGRKESVK